jgi:hypothetical protein
MIGLLAKDYIFTTNEGDKWLSLRLSLKFHYWIEIHHSATGSTMLHHSSNESSSKIEFSDC